jgi:phosphoglycolate phosphatase
MSALEFPLAVRAVAIDLDGTLLDTVEDLATAVNHMLAELHLPALGLDRVRPFVGKGLANLVARSRSIPSLRVCKRSPKRLCTGSRNK